MKVISNYKTTLSASMTSSQNTVPVTSILTTDGHTITASDFDSIAYLVIEPGSANMEIVKITGISGNSFTGAVRGLAFYGGTETSVSANQKDHQAGVDVIMTNSHYYYDKMVDLDSNETITGQKTFTTAKRPKLTSDVDSTVDEELITFGQLYRSITGGGVDADSTHKGISYLSSNPSVPTSPIALNSEEVSAAGGTGAGENKVIRANASGYIDKDYIEVAANKGLEFSGNSMQVKAGTGILLDSSGINVDVGTTANKLLRLDNNAKIPAVDGSQLIAIPPILNTCSASDNLKISADTERTTNSTSYTKLKEIQISLSGIIRVKFDLAAASTIRTVNGRIYKNNVAIGTERSDNTGVYTTFSEDISVSVGDVIEIYAHTNADTVVSAKIRNFRIYYNKSSFNEYQVNLD